VHFYQLQMSLHHPHGAVDELHGAFAVSWDIWKVSVLVHLFVSHRSLTCEHFVIFVSTLNQTIVLCVLVCLEIYIVDYVVKSVVRFSKTTGYKLAWPPGGW